MGILKWTQSYILPLSSRPSSSPGLSGGYAVPTTQLRRRTDQLTDCCVLLMCLRERHLEVCKGCPEGNICISGRLHPPGPVRTTGSACADSSGHLGRPGAREDVLTSCHGEDNHEVRPGIVCVGDCSPRHTPLTPSLWHFGIPQDGRLWRTFPFFRGPLVVRQLFLHGRESRH